jgi:hypothetical protein
MIITDEMKTAALFNQAVAPNIVGAAELILLARGEDDPTRVIFALLGAAWFKHKQTYGAQAMQPFANLVEGWADSIRKMAAPN